MANSPAANIAGLLVNGGLGTAGSTIFVGKDPGGTSQTITLFDYAGSNPNPKYARDEPRVQIMVYGAQNNYSGAYDKALAIKNYLLGRSSQTIGTEIYFAFRMIGDITFVGYDSNSRPMFSLNWRFFVDGPTANNRLSV